MGFLNQLWDTLKGVAPTVAGGAVTAVTGGNPIFGAIVAKTIRGVLGTPDDGSELKEVEAEQIVKNPELYLKFKTEMANLEIEAMKENTKRLDIVNTTMRAEAKSDSIWQQSWRPFNGYMFGITLFCDYFVSQVFVNVMNSNITWVHIPASVYMLWTTVLGVAATSRGFEKVSKTKLTSSSMGDTAKNFVSGMLGK